MPWQAGTETLYSMKLFSVFSEISGGLYSLKETLFVSPFENRQTNKTPQKPKPKNQPNQTPTKSNQKPTEKGTLIIYYYRKWERGQVFCWLLMKKNLLAVFTDLGLFF